MVGANRHADRLYTHPLCDFTHSLGENSQRLRQIFETQGRRPALCRAPSPALTPCRSWGNGISEVPPAARRREFQIVTNLASNALILPCPPLRGLSRLAGIEAG